MIQSPDITQLGNRDPQGTSRFISPEYGSAIRVPKENQIIENGREYSQQVAAIASELQKRSKVILDNYELQGTDEDGFIFSFNPRRDMTSMTILDMNGADYYEDEEDYSGKDFFLVVKQVAEQFEMSPDELYTAVAPLFFTRTNSHYYYLINVPQN